MNTPAVGMLEFKSIAKGIFATDVMVKKSKVEILKATHISPGKYMTIITGEVGEVDEALKAGINSVPDMLINKLFLQHAHFSIIPAIKGELKKTNLQALGILETFSVVSCVKAADVAAKAARVEIVQMKLANNLGGKGYFVMTGELNEVEHALNSAVEFAKSDGMLASFVTIPAPHPQMLEEGGYW
jgi:microcompartment protein CcmL/EutN